MTSAPQFFRNNSKVPERNVPKMAGKVPSLQKKKLKKKKKPSQHRLFGNNVVPSNISRTPVQRKSKRKEKISFQELFLDFILRKLETKIKKCIGETSKAEPRDLGREFLKYNNISGPPSKEKMLQNYRLMIDSCKCKECIYDLEKFDGAVEAMKKRDKGEKDKNGSVVCNKDGQYSKSKMKKSVIGEIEHLCKKCPTNLKDHKKKLRSDEQLINLTKKLDKLKLNKRPQLRNNKFTK